MPPVDVKGEAKGEQIDAKGKAKGEQKGADEQGQNKTLSQL